MITARSSSALQVRSMVARVIISRAYSKDYASSSDDEKEPKKSKKPEKQTKEAKPADKVEESAANRLNRLLASMQTQTNFTHEISMAKPGEGHKKLKKEAKEAGAKNDVFEAAKRVASLLGEDKQKTESELLSKLLGRDKGDVLTEDQVVTEGGNENELSLSELIVGMKIDRSKQPKESGTRADIVRRAIASKQQFKKGGEESRNYRYRQESKREAESFTGSVNLFGGEPLGIFKDVSQLRDSPDFLKTWAHLQQHELKLQVTHPPANHFQKMVLWTEQGKLWQFPINNEQGISEEEVNEDFSEHIFLEQHLEAWCPTKGPIRHFMELVCVGLSKNPYITAREKKEHILWYRDYFESKKDILKDLMSQEKMEQVTGGKKQLADA